MKSLPVPDAEFATLYREYRDRNRELPRLIQSSKPDAIDEATDLRMRHTVVEEVLLKKIEGYEPG